MSRSIEPADSKIIVSPPADDSLNFARRYSDRISAQALGFSGVVGFCTAWAIAGRVDSLTPAAHLLLFAGLTALPMIVLSLFVNQTHLRKTSGLLPTAGKANWPRCGIKIVGLLATLAILGTCYWLFPEYNRSHYAMVWEAAQIAALPLLAITIGYFIWTDRRMADPEDGYWHFGSFVLGRWHQVDYPKLREYALGWLIKGFFLPFMLSGVAEHAVVLLKEGWNPSTFATLYLTSFTVILAVDTVFGAIGYLLTLRILDAHIRSPQPTWLGWVSTIICYVPFSQFLHRAFLEYKGDIDWSAWLSNQPIIFVSWGFAILVLQAIYVWATISFGCRFSNLTNRGIIVDGPYRYMKHPAYLAKNLAWWLISVPFVAHGDFLLNLKACILLGLTNVIYFIRAKTEEYHLSEDPAYRIYADWIRECGWGATAKNLAVVVKNRFLPRSFFTD
ncbi:MAG: hypothetical protein IAE94_06945 [Chthoniobacterales bacterium]|nr:hypothetical protein [Chthoniobacterales bacterium]